jgi:hypothetical protein
MLDNDEAAILELLAIRPLSYFPPLPRSIAEQLALKVSQSSAMVSGT